MEVLNCVRDEYLDQRAVLALPMSFLICGVNILVALVLLIAGTTCIASLVSTTKLGSKATYAAGRLL